MKTDVNDVLEGHFNELCEKQVRGVTVDPKFLSLIEEGAENEEDPDFNDDVQCVPLIDPSGNLVDGIEDFTPEP